jgi:hypothetical protein
MVGLGWSVLLSAMTATSWFEGDRFSRFAPIAHPDWPADDGGFFEAFVRFMSLC